ncbi:MAG TPA: hypothetical protein VMY38_06615 [Gemmatimonadaceae bacterium]|nr:hypothetical protein [Gemmatimonadaceae bacterium]
MGSVARIATVLLVSLSAVPATAGAQARPRVDRSKITAEQIAARPASNVHDLIRSLRSNWFHVRGSATMQSRDAVDPYSGKAVTVPLEPVIVVYVDGIRFGVDENLKSMPTTDIALIERLDAVTATQRFGTNHEHGAIVITMRTR